jgi:hypothetical protein
MEQDTNQSRPLNVRISIARWVSIVGHPFFLIALLALLVSWTRGVGADGLRIAGIITAAGLIPLGVFIWRRYATGRWETVDASRPENRPALYIAAFVVLVPLGLYFLLVERSADMVRGSAAFASMLGVAAAANRWIKLSLHMAFAVFAGLIAARLSLVYGVVMLVFVPMLGWSRVALRRHTLREVFAGCILGVIVAIITLWPYL